LKGSIGPAKNLSAMIAALMFTGVVMALYVFAINITSGLHAIEGVASNQMNAIDLAYMAEDCLRENGEYYIEKATLDSFSQDQIKQKCGITVEDAGILVTNREIKQEWNFDYDDGAKFRHGIFVNIKEGDSIYVGELNASIDK